MSTKAFQSTHIHAEHFRGGAPWEAGSGRGVFPAFRARVLAVGTRRVSVYTRLHECSMLGLTQQPDFRRRRLAQLLLGGCQAGGESDVRGYSASSRKTSFNETPRGGGQPLRPAGRRRRRPWVLPKSSDESPAPQPGSADRCPLRCLAERFLRLREKFCPQTSNSDLLCFLRG